MGKYMKKGKITGNMAVVEVSQSVVGVRTRAKTLALQQNPDVCYLQLRSRRLEKPRFPPPSIPTNQDKNNRGSTNQTQIRKSGSMLRVESVKSRPAGSASFSRSKKGEFEVDERFGEFGAAIRTEEVDNLGVEASFGENNLEFDGTGRSTRESTPCSLKRDLEGVGTPGSAVRSTCSGAVDERRARDLLQRSSPSTREMEEFFATAERQQQKQFMDKYNFDVLNGLPHTGRYEWARVDL